MKHLKKFNEDVYAGKYYDPEDEERRRKTAFQDSFKKDKFILLKNVGKLKKGKVFDSFGGLVRGAIFEVDGKELKINFDDKNYFKPTGVENFFQTDGNEY